MGLQMQVKSCNWAYDYEIKCKKQTSIHPLFKQIKWKRVFWLIAISRNCRKYFIF